MKHPHANITVPLLVLVFALLPAVACGGAEGNADTEGEGSGVTDRGPFGGLVRGEAAPELAGTGEWFNSEPLTLAELREAGRVVLVDFWTYTCVNCQRTQPFLRDWHAKYADHGLTIIGVHTPEFRFEEDAENVARAVREAGIRFPVAQDNDRETWRAFDNHVWPAKYLIGADGRVVYRHFGEGNYEETEHAIRGALTEAGWDVLNIPIGGITAPALDDNAAGMTRELYFGYEQNYQPGGAYAAQEAYYATPDAVLELEDPGPPRRGNIWYAHGLWNNADHAMVHLRDTEEFEEYVTFRFTARSVNSVLSRRSSGPIDVLVQLDGFALRPEEAGPDVHWDEMGRSIVTVDDPRMYRVVELPAPGEHVLRLSVRDTGFKVHSVTFGAYTEGP